MQRTWYARRRGETNERKPPQRSSLRLLSSRRFLLARRIARAAGRGLRHRPRGGGLEIGLWTLLAHHGVDGSKVKSQGHGMSQPVKTCDQKDRKALIACLAPNRRVEIEINGTKR